MTTKPLISCFVITYNRAHILPAVLKRVRWVDELVVIDKGDSTNTLRVINNEEDQRRDRPIIYEPEAFSPVVEQTRAHAQSLCTGDWILCLDDDEILSPGAEVVIKETIANNPSHDIHRIPIHNYILGRHFNTEFRHCLYRKGTIKYSPIVHSKPELFSEQILSHPADGPLFITHLSHPNVASWIEKTNRYTSQNRYVEEEVIRQSKQIQSYTDAVVQLKRLYSQIDALKIWEKENLPDGEKEFLRIVGQVMTED